jgi:CRP-like cAMP-binding protein
LIERDAVLRLIKRQTEPPPPKEATPPPSQPPTPPPEKNTNEIAIPGQGDADEEDKYSEPPESTPRDLKKVEKEDLFPIEKAYFESMMLDRIDSVPHKGARTLLQWSPLKDEHPLEYMKLPGQTFFFLDDSLGMTQSGPLPEGLEDRYFLDGQLVLKRGVPGDCAVLILRGQVEAEVPEGCEGNCVHSAELLAAANIDLEKEGSWLGKGDREPPPPPPPRPPTPPTPEPVLVPVKGKKNKFIAQPKTPPPPTPPKEPVPPRAILGPGDILGRLTLLGVPVVLPGNVRAKGPCVVAVLHRHALIEALQGYQELSMFKPLGISEEERSKILLAPCLARQEGKRPDHLGPATGPPPHRDKDMGAPASTISAWRDLEGRFSQRPGADALEMVMLNALHQSALMHKICDEAPPRLLRDFLGCFEPRFLWPNEIVVVDEEPDADFLVIVIYGSFLVMLEGLQIDLVHQGAMLGEAQVLGLNDWTRTVMAHPKNDGEAMIQVMKRSKMVEVLAGHPVPKLKLRAVEAELIDAKVADWRILARVPTFLSIATKPFLSRLQKDADILFFCPGDHIARSNDEAASLIVVLAGTCRCEQPLTLFCLELKRGDWCFQNNILGNDATRQHDVVAITHTMVMILHRHAMLNAVTAFPATRRVILENERWRSDVPLITSLRCYERVPVAVTMQLDELASPMYCARNSIMFGPGDTVDDDSLLLILRGEVVISIMGIEVRTLKAGDTIGLLRYLKLAVEHSNTTFRATKPCDMMRIPQGPMDEAEVNELFEDELQRWFMAKRTLGGGPILDQYGFDTGHGGVLATRCIEESDVFSVCSPGFVAQIPKLVEDVCFYPGEQICQENTPGDAMWFVKAGRVRVQMIGVPDEMVEPGGTVGEQACIGLVNEQPSTALAETHVWARVLYKPLLKRALVAFDGEESRLTGARDRGAVGCFDD